MKCSVQGCSGEYEKKLTGLEDESGDVSLGINSPAESSSRLKPAIVINMAVRFSVLPLSAGDLSLGDVLFDDKNGYEIYTDAKEDNTMTAQPLRHEYEPKATFIIKSWDQERADKLIQVLDEWMADESGYEEETWPKLRAALDRERENISARRLFNE